MFCRLFASFCFARAFFLKSYWSFALFYFIIFGFEKEHVDVSFCFVFTPCFVGVELFFEEKESIRVGLLGAGDLRELVGRENRDCEQQLTELALSP